MILRGRGRSAVAGRGRRLSDSGGGARGPPRSTGAGEGVLSQADPEMAMPAVTFRLTGELRPARGDELVAVGAGVAPGRGRGDAIR